MAEIKEVVSENQKRCDEDLARAEPAVRQAEAALDTLNKVSRFAIRIAIETIAASRGIFLIFLLRFLVS